MWITNQKAFKKSAVVFWPGSEVKIEGQYPTHYLPYNRSLSFEKRIDYLCTMLEQDDPPTILATHFNEPDHSGHKFGPYSPAWAQLFEGRLALNPGLNLTLVSLSCVQKHFLG